MSMYYFYSEDKQIKELLFSNQGWTKEMQSFDEMLSWKMFHIKDGLKKKKKNQKTQKQHQDKRPRLEN